MKKYTGKTVKVAIIDKDGETNPWVGTCNDDESNYLKFKYWSKGNYERIYVNDYKNRSVGYIDLKTEEIETEYSVKSDYYKTMQYFLDNYEIDIDD